MTWEHLHKTSNTVNDNKLIIFKIISWAITQFVIFLTNLVKLMYSGTFVIDDVYSWIAPCMRNVVYDNLLKGMKNLCDKNGSRIPVKKNSKFSI